MVRGKDSSQQLDAESAAGLAKLKDEDAEIDAGIDAISKTIDNLNNIAGQMRDEVRNININLPLNIYGILAVSQTQSQNQKLEKIENNMQKTTEKQTVVNARQRYLLK